MNASVLFPVFCLLLTIEVVFSQPDVQQLNQRFQQCCMENGVPTQCARDMCHYGFDGDTREGRCTIWECHKHLPIFISCGTAEQDLTQCFKRKNIDDDCVGRLGSGNVPKLEDIFCGGRSYLRCLSKMREMMECDVEVLQITGLQPQCTSVCANPSTLESYVSTDFSDDPTVCQGKASRYYKLFGAVFSKCCFSEAQLRGKKDYCMSHSHSK